MVAQKQYAISIRRKEHWHSLAETFSNVANQKSLRVNLLEAIVILFD